MSDHREHTHWLMWIWIIFQFVSCLVLEQRIANLERQIFAQTKAVKP